MEQRKRLAILLTHPIQYYAPLLRKIAAQPMIDSMTYYLRNPRATTTIDKEFGKQVTWDIPLLEGYQSEFLPLAHGASGRPLGAAFFKRLREGKFDFLFVFGFTHPFRIFAIILGSLMGIKILVRDDANLVARQRSSYKMLLKKMFFAFLNLFVFRFMAVGTRNRDYYLAHGIPAHKILTMSWAVDNDFFYQRALESQPLQAGLRQALGIGQTQPVLLFVGKFSARKGIRELLAAFKTAYAALDVKPALVFVGDGDLRGEIESAMLECQGIKIAGFKNQTELPAYYQLCDLIILPSKHLETWGLVINEAMSAGKPAIISDKVGCAPDLIIPNKTGWVFPDGNIAELTSLLKSAFETPENLQGMRKDCLNHIGQFSIAQNLQVLNEIFFENTAARQLRSVDLRA